MAMYLLFQQSANFISHKARRSGGWKFSAFGGAKGLLMHQLKWNVVDIRGVLASLPILIAGSVSNADADRQCHVQLQHLNFL